MPVVVGRGGGADADQEHMRNYYSTIPGTKRADCGVGVESTLIIILGNPFKYKCQMYGRPAFTWGLQLIVRGLIVGGEWILQRFLVPPPQ